MSNPKIETIKCIGQFRGRTVIFTLPAVVVKDSYTYKQMSDHLKYWNAIKVVDAKTKEVIKEIKYGPGYIS